MTKAQIDNQVDQLIPVGTRRGVTAANVRLILHSIINFIIDWIKGIVGSEITYPTTELNETHIGRLFCLDDDGKAVLTQKTGGGTATPAIFKYKANEADALELPVNPIFLLTINSQFTDGETLILPHPNPSGDLDTVFTAKTTPTLANEFEIGATIEDSRDNLKAKIETLWEVTDMNSISVTSISTDGIQIEILKTLTNFSSGFGNFRMPSDFNGVEEDIVTTMDVDYAQTQLGSDGYLQNAYYFNGSEYTYRQDASCHLLNGSDKLIKVLPVFLISPALTLGVPSWGQKFAQDGTDIMNNLIEIFNGAVSNDIEVYHTFDISAVINEGDDRVVVITQTDLNVLLPTLTAVNELAFPNVEIIQQFSAASSSFVYDQVIGFVAKVEGGLCYASKSYLNRGVLLTGSNTLPAPEMGDFAHYKKLLLPSNDGKLENSINWGAELATPSPAVAAALYLNGGYVGVEDKASGNILVKPQYIQS